MGQTLRILSANLKNGGADPVAFANLVAALAVDVLAVQEVAHDQAALLAEQFDHGEIEPDHNYVGMGLLARHSVVIERVEMSWGFGQTVHLSAADWRERGQGIEITNLHVAAPHMYRPLPGPWLRWRQARELAAYLEHADRRDDFCACQRDPQKRCESTSSSSATKVKNGEGAPSRPGVANDNSPPPPRLIVGDFNATPYWPWYRRMVSQFTDAAVAVADKTGVSPRPTWGPWPGSPKVLRIDHGFLRGLTVEEFEVFEVVGSDHSAVVMDLTLPVSSADR
ncbi:MAG: endonuclease/exonuclease/phosphatase family protein [bacterium]|nr:endonuclease/exonuclease/phosphatase family protein [bacterium]MCP5044497.1 endonuclease/exonuclease/phosphatase family protein [bacterium]